MRKALLSTAAMALALGLSSHAWAEQKNVNDGLAIQLNKATRHSNNDNGDFRNNNLDLTLTNKFSKSAVVAASKLYGTVSHNKVYDIGNVGGDAGWGGRGGSGDDGGDATVRANGGKAYAGDGGKGSKGFFASKGKGGDGGDAWGGAAAASNATGGDGGNGGKGGSSYGGDAGVFNASNTLSGMSGVAGVTTAIQNTGIASLQQVAVTTMANVSIR
jgi:hypothetical protein